MFYQFINNNYGLTSLDIKSYYFTNYEIDYRMGSIYGFYGFYFIDYHCYIGYIRLANTWKSIILFILSIKYKTKTSTIIRHILSFPHHIFINYIYSDIYYCSNIINFYNKLINKHKNRNKKVKLFERKLNLRI